MFGDRQQMRQMYIDAWRKFRDDQPVSPLERIIGETVAEHPEYQALLENPDKALDKDYLPEGGETNPFLHMGMHISIREQLDTDRPPGIRALYQQMAMALGGAHPAEHQMMDCLGQMLWEAQRANRAPSETDYLSCLRSKLQKPK